MKKIFLFVCPLFFLSALRAVEADSSTATKVSLEDCLQIGLKNYEPLKLSDEEVELARLKRQEAYRALYPALSFKAEETTGETSDRTISPEFTERLYGASMSQSIFGGGKLLATYKQSVASHLAAEQSRDKTWQDFIYGVHEAYWKLVAAQNNFLERESVRETIKNDLKIVTEQYVLDLAVKQQFLAAKGQYLQANSQANATRVSYSKAKWTLAKALGLSRPPEFNLRGDIPFQKLEADLDDLLALAAGHRPDLVMQENLVALARYGRKAAAAAQWPQLSLNGFYGRSAAAYEGDSLNYRDDWQISARVMQSFLGSSVGVSGSKINTSPKLGQSTRTDSETKGVNLNVLDGMKDRTELKQADLGLRQAAVKRDDLRKDVAIDVEDAYYNFQQALLQVEFTEEDLKLAEEELSIAESKGKYGLSTALELAQTRNRNAASKAARMDALAAYQISLAALNRAVGIADKFKVE